jgi:hypothetical protein
MAKRNKKKKEKKTDQGAENTDASFDHVIIRFFIIIQTKQ